MFNMNSIVFFGCAEWVFQYFVGYAQTSQPK